MEVEQYLREFCNKYYSEHEIDSVPSIKHREFGVGSFGQKISRRHLSFDSNAALNKFLRSEVPFFISYSNAYYRYPERRPMQNKEFLKADIVYEFDADDIKTPCKENHDSWKCKACSATGKGAIEKCTSCGEHVEVEQWVCNECLNAVKKQVFRLLDFLENDFAIIDGISINFSGHKGYHIHLRSEKLQHLSQSARIELLDYLTAHEFSKRSHGFFMQKVNKRMVCPPKRTALAWDKRILDGIVSLFQEGREKELAKAGNISTKLSKELISERQRSISDIERGLLLALPGRRTEQFWNSVVDCVVDKIKLNIDRQTSVDISKIIRVPNTIHGSTGFIAKNLEISELKSFDPLEQAVIKSPSSVKVKVLRTPKFNICGESFGPFNQEEVELPEHVSVYLLSRGAADAVIL